MASKRRKDRSRREPVFDANPAAALDLRLEARDRPAGAPHTKPEGERRRRPPPERMRRSEPPPERPARRAAKGSGGHKGRSRGIRLIYWAVVLALWLGIAGIAAIVWVGAHLPAIQSLEVPKRPPSIEILGADGRVLATRGDMGGAALARDPIARSAKAPALDRNPRRRRTRAGDARRHGGRRTCPRSNRSKCQSARPRSI